MLNQNNTPAQFLKFYKDFKASGTDPEQFLNELLSSGKISKEQLDQAVNKAKGMSFLLNLIK